MTSEKLPEWMADLIDKGEPASTCFDLYKRMQVAERAEKAADRDMRKSEMDNSYRLRELELREKYSRLSDEDSRLYDKIKTAILVRYELTSEAYRENKPPDLKSLVEPAEAYQTAHKDVGKGNDKGQSSSDFQMKPQSKSNGNNRGQYKRETRTCFVCNRKGHIAPDWVLRNKSQFKEVEHKQDKLALCLEKREQTGPCSTVDEYAFKSGDFFRLLNDASYGRDLEQDITKKNAPNKVKWLDIHQRSFDAFKHEICKNSVLRSPDLNRKFLLRTDASQFGLDAVLEQDLKMEDIQ
ncbi:unnamed protein product [Mytilus coruscus]|uniref:Reverse transcriptase/retrotransposon-derived protein RNase H-like domain-containing protein n=1 Tax=Mytilus coruscus TaxID=42192 RepID=A0A6J8CMJ7_MYTCO|nr:unnamed protein product [Mytilus coruscus]